MGGYADSTYYGKLDVLVDLLMDWKITQETFDRKSLEYLDDELGWSDGWLASHFNSTAEYLLESVESDDELPRPFDEMVKIAEDEIACFKKHGYDASCMETWLERAKEMYAYA